MFVKKAPAYSTDVDGDDFFDNQFFILMFIMPFFLSFKLLPLPLHPEKLPLFKKINN